MYSLEMLKNELRVLKQDLANITVKEHGSKQWGPGVQDQFDSESYSYDKYLDEDKARMLKSKIEDLEFRIRNYAKEAQQESAMEEIRSDMGKTSYEYTSNGEIKHSKNRAIAERHNAQQRMFGMSKVQRIVSKITGKQKKFEALWRRAAFELSKEEEDKVADELSKMFR